MKPISMQEWQHRIDQSQGKLRYRILELGTKGTKSKLRCSTHGVFYGNCDSLAKIGHTSCPECKQEATRKSKHLKSLEVLQDILSTKFSHLHLEDTSQYQGVNTPIEFVCDLHGPFIRKPAFLTRESKHGCPGCTRDSLSQGAETRTRRAWQHALSIYTGHMKFSRYQDKDTPIKTFCTVHGREGADYMPAFMADRIRHNHSFKANCPECLTEIMSSSQIRSTSEYLAKLEACHSGTVKLLSAYSGSLKKATFQCQTCGHKWKTAADSTVRNPPHGCPRCVGTVSKPESDLYQWVLSLCPDALQSVRQIYSEEFDRLLEWDIYVPSKQIAIEFNGLFYHRYPAKPKNYHHEKTKLSEERGVKLIHVYEDDWRHNNTVVKKTLRYLLGCPTERFYARKLRVKVREKLNSVYRNFYRKNHMQGPPRSGITVSLLDVDNSVKAAMTFCRVQSERGHSSNSEYELIRFACTGQVVGGASRLFKKFLSTYDAKRIVSYSDNDLFDGRLYTTLGFSMQHETGPDYTTVWGGRRRHKSYTRRQHLQKLLGSKFDSAKSEMANLLQAGVFVIFNSGRKKWVYK